MILREIFFSLPMLKELHFKWERLMEDSLKINSGMPSNSFTITISRISKKIWKKNIPNL